LGEFFNEDQILGTVLFVIGIFLLTWLSKTEKKQEAIMRDPKLKWAYIDAKGKKRAEVKKRNSRSILFTLIGGGMALYGFFSFLVNVK
jgi:hypothetical protein